MSDPRILAIMGSGETAPTMGKIHRALFERLGPGPVTGAIIDTPYGFQENADELSRRTLEFFGVTVGREMTIASYRSRGVGPAAMAAAVSRIRDARYVMAGPGSPSYALRHWAGSPIPAALEDKLERGGIVTMASAAALTLGVVTIPVYEIYKVGEDPHWLDGLDLLGPATGLRAAVVPHYDNAEGGSHDTRFCYMGERRLRVLEQGLPEGVFILGVDGHTALVLDLDEGVATVSGLGGVTIRVAGRRTRLPSGTAMRVGDIASIARGLAAGEPAEDTHAASEGRAGGRVAPAVRSAVLHDEMEDLEGSFADALAHDAVPDAVRVLLELETVISARLRSGEDSPDLDIAAAVFRSLFVRLGDHVEGQARTLRPRLDLLVSALLDLRAHARARRDWETADLIRDRLFAAHIEVRDGPDGSRVLPRTAPAGQPASADSPAARSNPGA